MGLCEMKFTEDSFQGLPQDVAFFIERYLSKPNTLASLFKLTKVPCSTLSRYASRDCMDFKFENVMAILEHTADIDERLLFFKRYYPHCYRILKGMLKVSDPKIQNSDLSDLLKDSKHYLVYSLSQVSGGTSIDYLKSLEANRYINGLVDACYNLVEFGYLKDDNGRIEVSDNFDGWRVTDRSTEIDVIKSMLSYTPIDRYQTHFKAFGVNEAAKEKLLELNQDYLDKVSEIVTSDKNRGDNLYMLGSVINVIQQDLHK